MSKVVTPYQDAKASKKEQVAQMFTNIAKTYDTAPVRIKEFRKIVLKERNHLMLLSEISDEFNKILLKFKQSTKVKIIVASPLEENIGSTVLNSLKTITNSFYGDLFSQDKALITHYVHEFYQDFIEQYKDVIISIDVDRVVIDQKKSEENKISFDRGLKGISFTTSPLKYYYNEELHNFVAEDETGKTWSHGFDSHKVKQLQSQIKAETRRRTLTDLGI
jgi:hypothetical protein